MPESIKGPKIKWIVKKVRLGDIKPFEHNPRFITIEAYNQLTQSMNEDGYAELVEVDKDLTIVSGHQRIRVMYDDYGWTNDKMIDVRMPERKLTEKEFKRRLLRANRMYGKNDDDMLANYFTEEELAEGFFSKEELGVIEEMNGIAEQEYDEDITDGEHVMVAFKVRVPDDDAVSFENQLDELLAKFPRAKKEKKI